MKNKTTVKDKGYSKIMRNVAIMKNTPYVKVGLPEENSETTDDEKGITNLELGLINEFGNENVPERSHHRKAFDLNLAPLKTLTDKLFKKIVEGKMSPTDALETIGLKMVSNIQKLIRGGIEPPVKRGGTPLLDTGQYASSITHVVKDKK